MSLNTFPLTQPKAVDCLEGLHYYPGRHTHTEFHRAYVPSKSWAPKKERWLEIARNGLYFAMCTRPFVKALDGTMEVAKRYYSSGTHDIIQYQTICGVFKTSCTLSVYIILRQSPGSFIWEPHVHYLYSAGYFIPQQLTGYSKKTGEDVSYQSVVDIIETGTLFSVKYGGEDTLRPEDYLENLPKDFEPPKKIFFQE